MFSVCDGRRNIGPWYHYLVNDNATPSNTAAYPALVRETAQILGISGANQHAGSYWQVLLRRVNKSDPGRKYMITYFLKYSPLPGGGNTK
jgi:hypothetical protein